MLDESGPPATLDSAIGLQLGRSWLAVSGDLHSLHGFEVDVAGGDAR